MSINGRAKGKSAERAAAKLLMQWVHYAANAVGMCVDDPRVPVLTRNLAQARGGGYDITGIEWLALEVKFRERLNLKQWWAQTLRQAGPGQMPVLMYRRSYEDWTFRCRPLLPVATPTEYIDHTSEQFARWFIARMQRELA